MAATKKQTSRPRRVPGHAELMSFRAGRFVYTADSDMVVVTKDSPSGIETVNCYEYATHARACDAAWKMSRLQQRA